MARILLHLLLTTATTALKPTRRLFFSNAVGAACGVALPARADSGVPMDLGPLGLRNGGSGKLNSCPPQGIKRACISTSKFDTDLYVPPWTYQSAKPDGQGGYAMTGGDSKSVEQAFSELVNAVAAQPGANIVEKGTKADGRYLRAEFTIPKSLPFGSDEIDDVELKPILSPEFTDDGDQATSQGAMMGTMGKWAALASVIILLSFLF